MFLFRCFRFLLGRLGFVSAGISNFLFLYSFFGGSQLSLLAFPTQRRPSFCGETDRREHPSVSATVRFLWRRHPEQQDSLSRHVCSRSFFATSSLPLCSSLTLLSASSAQLCFARKSHLWELIILVGSHQK